MQGLALVQPPQSQLLDHTVRQEHVTSQSGRLNPALWASLARLLSHNPGLQRDQRQAFQGHGNIQFFKIEMRNIKKKKSLGIQQFLSLCGTWPLMENVRAEQGLQGYLLSCPHLSMEVDLLTSTVAEPGMESPRLLVY